MIQSEHTTRGGPGQSPQLGPLNTKKEDEHMKNMIGITAILAFIAALYFAGRVEAGGGTIPALLSAAALAVLALATWAGNRRNEK